MPKNDHSPSKKKKKPNKSKKSSKAKKTVPNQKEPVERRSLTPRFKAVFLAVVLLTLLSLIGYVTLAIIIGMNSIESSALNGVIETLKTAFISGFGAILGLLGGKAL